MTKRHIYIDDDNHVDGLRKFRFLDTGHQPSWKRYGKDGYASIEVWSHARNQYLQFDAAEGTTNGKRTFEKRTMVTLDADEARQFYAWLKKQFEPEAVTPGDAAP